MNEAKDELLCLECDSHFLEIADLKWLPWIGKEYFNSESRVLIIGESHYLLDEHDPHYAKNKEEVNSPQKDFTRNVVQTFCVNNKKPQPTFDNLTRCLSGKQKVSPQKRMELWQHLAFYNFVQRPMKSNKKRPKSEDMQTGWKVFAELIKMLKPTKCIFIGFAAADSYNPYICEHGEKVGRCAARLFSAKIDENTSCPCIAIKHTSQYFSWKKWHEVLNNNNFLFRLQGFGSMM